MKTTGRHVAPFLVIAALTWLFLRLGMDLFPG